jgi:hypothetical protein
VYHFDFDIIFVSPGLATRFFQFQPLRQRSFKEFAILPRMKLSRVRRRKPLLAGLVVSLLAIRREAWDIKRHGLGSRAIRSRGLPSCWRWCWRRCWRYAQYAVRNAGRPSKNGTPMCLTNGGPRSSTGRTGPAISRPRSAFSRRSGAPSAQTLPSQDRVPINRYFEGQPGLSPAGARKTGDWSTTPEARP